MKYKLIILGFFAFLFTTNTVIAQDMIDEDFIADLQKKAAPLWAETDPDFNTNTIPAKWSDESAVVLGYKKYLGFDKEGYFLRKKKDLEILEKRRFKIMLMDNSSLKQFSTLYFRYASKKDGFGVRVIKADGTMQDIPLNRAVAIDDNDDVPEFFKGTLDRQVSKRDEYYKVPVSNLQPGDIVEYVSVTFNVKDVTPRNGLMFYQGASVFQFDDQYELCHKPYPIMLHKIVIETDQNTFLSSRSLNGAPAFSVTKNGVNDVFTWIDRDRERMRDINFLNELRVAPLLKFSLTYASNFNAQSLFIGEAGQIKNSFDEREIVLKAKAILNKTQDATIMYEESSFGRDVSFTVSSLAREIWDYLKSNNQHNSEGYEYIQSAHIAFCGIMNANVTDKVFVCVMAELFKKRKIEYEILVTTPNNLTAPTDIISESELVWLIKAGDEYIFRPNGTSYLSDMAPEYAGNTAYKITDDASEAVIKSQIPSLKRSDNSFFEVYKVSFDTAAEKYTIENKLTQKGVYAMYARQFIGTLGTNGIYYFFPCKEKVVNPKSKTKVTTYEEYVQSSGFKLELTKAMEIRKKEHEDEFGVDIVFDTLVINNYGNCVDSPRFVYTEKFSVKSKQRRAGKKILLNLPSIIGGQLHLKDDERQRQYDANVRFPRNLGFTIQFAVPKGYTLEGLKNLDAIVDNEVGNFVCTTFLENDTATIKVVKSYKMLEIPKEKWPQMVAFTDAAYNFTQKLVLLKPKE